jgi:hypothetical protein
MRGKKYKQTEIPSVEIIEPENRVKFIKEYYSANLQGKKVVNKDILLTIHFTSIGKYELAYARAPYASKIAVLLCLEKLLEIAEYNNFGQRKDTDKQNVLGYFNFKAKVQINGRIEHARISVVLKKDGKAYYNHEINVIK